MASALALRKGKYAFNCSRAAPAGPRCGNVPAAPLPGPRPAARRARPRGFPQEAGPGRHFRVIHSSPGRSPVQREPPRLPGRLLLPLPLVSSGRGAQRPRRACRVPRTCTMQSDTSGAGPGGARGAACTCLHVGAPTLPRRRPSSGDGDHI